MHGPSLSPSEMTFFKRFAPMVDSITADLADLYSQLPYSTPYSIGVLENTILSGLTNIPVLTQDVENDLRELSQQTLDLIRRQLLAPVADFEGEPIPVL